MRITPEQAQAIMASGEDHVILDVREAWKFETLDKIKGAKHVYVEDLPAQIEAVIPNKETKVLIYCTAGVKSAKADQILTEMGYTQSLDFGGLDQWTGDVVSS